MTRFPFLQCEFLLSHARTILVRLLMIKKASSKKRIVLLDTHAIIHRAYHALPEFTGAWGAPRGALYGLVAMLLKIITDLKPDYLAACYDLAKPTIRHEAYESYKGTRAKLDDALTLQLVDDERVRVYTLKKGINDTILYDEKKVVERFGFSPTLIPDWKGLRGDPSDNIKGVPGIGEKTATDLITGFGGIEKIYAALKKKNGEEIFLKKGIKARVIGLLKEHEEDARFSKSLATIRLDAPIAFTLPEKPWRENIEIQKMFAMCAEFGFRTLKERIKTMFASGQEGRTIELVPEEKVDQARLTKAKIKLWLLASDFTNPTLDDVLAYTKKHSLDEADAVLTTSIHETGRLREVYENIEKPLIPIVRRMGEHGVLIDPAVLKSLAKEYRTELEKIEKRIYKSAGHEFNVSSPKQLGEVLFD